MKNARILVVDDNRDIRNALKLLLPMHFSQVELIPSPKTLVATVESFHPDVVLLDMNFNTDINAGTEGLYWTGELKKMYPDVQIVLFTAYADISLAVEGMKRGAFDFIVKPWNNDKIVSTLKAAYDSSPVRTRKTETPPVAWLYWGEGETMSQIRSTVEKIAPTDASVLITGENGTGKDLLAREIHNLSKRSGKPMVCVDLGAITETLFESELFGHVKGAFTDACSDYTGKFEQADGGTLFLDEIGNVPPHLQAKLLRVLQDRKVCRVGSEKPTDIDIRLICATNMDLEKMVEEGRFREDLYYRINTIKVHLPALRNRQDDIMPLAERFLSEFALRYRRSAGCFSPEAARNLMAHVWHGNIRELRNTVEKAVILSDGVTVKADNILIERRSVQKNNAGHTLDDIEEQAIREAMLRCKGNLTLVARELGISRPTLYSKLKKYDI